MNRSPRIFVESLVFYAISVLLPVLITWAAVADYGRRYPGEVIGVVFVGAVAVSMGILVGLLLGFYVLKRLLKLLRSQMVLVILALLCAYAACLLIADYGDLIERPGYIALWLASIVLVPALIVTVASLPQKLALRVAFGILGCVLQLGGLIMGTHAFGSNLTSQNFVNKVNTLGYTLYIPPSGAQWPQVPLFYDDAMTTTKTQIVMDTSKLGLQNDPGIINVYQLPRPADLPTPTCGPNYRAQDFDADITDNYTCRALSGSGSDAVYEMSYDYNYGLTTGVKEYFILKPNTVVFATYATTFNDTTPRTYDEAKSVDLLRHLIPVNGQELLNRLAMFGR